MTRSLLIALAVTTAGSVVGAQAPPSRVDWSKIADLVVNRSLKLTAGERVVLFWDQSSDRGAAVPLRAAIAAAGGVTIDLSAPTQSDLEAIARLSPAAQRLQQARRDSTWAQAFRGAEAAIWLPMATTGLAGRPFEHLVEKSKVRSIHFHWFLPPDPTDVDVVEALYARAVAVDPASIQERIATLEDGLKGATVKITAPNGTNLTVRIPATAWVHRNTGDASRAKIAAARSVRDREEELPASVFRTTDITGAEGTFVGYASFDTRSPILQATFAGGRVTKLESKRGAESIIATWEKATGDKALPGELVIGTNPELPTVLPSGFMPYYGYGAGVVRVAIGDNWESGGKNRSSNGEILMFVPAATVEANGKVLVRAGRLVP